MNNLTEHAKKELDRIGGKDDEMQEIINRNILDLIEMFSEQGHSGMTAPYVIRAFRRLAMFKTLTPLTGEDDEWQDVQDVGDNDKQQNRRCSVVFRKNKDNKTAYNIEGKVFSDNGGETWFTDKNSFVPVTFPYHIPDEPERIVLNKDE